MIPKNLVWKIERDPIYYPVYKRHGERAVFNAGFFLDSNKKEIKIEETLNILCTPLDHLKKPNVYIDDSRLCVLFSTGCYAPFHEGHLNGMEAAKAEMERNGWNVLGGFISPDHDEHVKQKTDLPGFGINQRIKTILEKIKGVDWLRVDPWRGVFNSCDTNFTDGMYRLDLYLQKYFSSNIKIIYVCGSDRGNFASSFLNDSKYGCVVVNRPGNTLINNPPNSKVYLAEGKVRQSSSHIRSWWTTESIKGKKDLILRLDDKYPSLDYLLKDSFKSITIQKSCDHEARRHDNFGDEKVISLDPLVYGDNNLEISRLYDLFGGNKLGYCPRPGSLDFKKQIDNFSYFPKGYVLLDDDMTTGETMQFATGMLRKEGIKISGIFSFNIGDQETEILDNRDFFIGEGLVVKLPNNKISRLPYLYPYVCPNIRGSILNPMYFSISAWNKQAEYFYDSGLELRDLTHIEGFLLAGYAKSDLVYNICLKHAELLEKCLIQ